MSLLTDQDRATLVRLLKVAYPHGSFPDGPYERTADAVLDAAAADPRQLAQLSQGLHDLDTLREVPFVELAEDAALAVLRGIQDSSSFFANVIGIAIVAFYGDHEVWELLGYEGPSFDQGGYINRGFDDLDWLPEPTISYSYEEVSA